MAKELVTPGNRQGTSVVHDRTLRVWDMETGDVITNYIGDNVLGTCAVSPDDQTIVAGEASGRVHLLQLEGVD